MKTLTTTLLLLTCLMCFGQKETTYSISIDSTEQKRVLLDSLLKHYSECDIFVITKIEKKKVYISRLCDKKHKSFPIKKEQEDIFEVGYFFTLIEEFKN